MNTPANATPNASTCLLDAAAVARIVRETGLARLIHLTVDRIEADFLRWTDFDKSARSAAHSAVGVIELMPVADARRYAFKYVNGHPGNTRLGLPTVMAFGVLADVATGAPLLLAELTLATAIRTAAMSALAARWLARPGSRTMALIGNGAQSEFQAIAMRELVGIRSLRLFDTDAAATDRLAAHLAGEGFEIVRCASAAQAVHGADIVTTATADKTRATIVTPDMVEPGQHFNAVGGDCPGKTELHADVLRRAQVFVEYEPQTRVEGDIQQLPTDHPVTEFWRVLSGQASGRIRSASVTVFDSVGFALEDYSMLTVLQARAQQMGIGESVALVPQMADPKNLYGTIRAGTPTFRLAA